MKLCKMSSLAASYSHLTNEELLLELKRFRSRHERGKKIYKQEKQVWSALLLLAQSRGVHETISAIGETIHANPRL